MYRATKSRIVDLNADAWTLPEVHVLGTPWERYVGIRADASSVMLLTRSVHTLTMHTPLPMMVLDIQGTVVRTEVMLPLRIAIFPKLVWVVETQSDTDLAVPGTQIVASTMPERCLEH